MRLASLRVRGNPAYASITVLPFTYTHSSTLICTASLCDASPPCSGVFRHAAAAAAGAAAAAAAAETARTLRAVQLQVGWPSAATPGPVGVGERGPGTGEASRRRGLRLALHGRLWGDWVSGGEDL